MPSYWYNLRDLTIHDDDDEETIENKEFNRRIAAYRKPYFMIYVYPTLKKEYNEYIKHTKGSMISRFCVSSIDELAALGESVANENIIRSIDYYYKRMPTGNNACVINRICWIFEKEFSRFTYYISKLPAFDYSMLKVGKKYTRDLYNQIKDCYKRHQEQNNLFAKTMSIEKKDAGFAIDKRLNLIRAFKKDCSLICTNEDDLCDIVLDMCYQSEGSKQFAWDVSGMAIVTNLLKMNDFTIHYPVMVDCDGDFTFCGRQFKMESKVIEEDLLEYYSE